MRVCEPCVIYIFNMYITVFYIIVDLLKRSRKYIQIIKVFVLGFKLLIGATWSRETVDFLVAIITKTLKADKI